MPNHEYTRGSLTSATKLGRGVRYDKLTGDSARRSIRMLQVAEYERMRSCSM
ncbi:hypothetical protein AG1IA_08345 [Rhizoctonia solani AG-1 IA]|uniref:Uncharacterized protein n=1 Tax=Thanatephorus cucumeris (strain AG1-IA) TaxID=983506 RepID=L8WLC4_THACA|nr:hypothetical protein AG1IA_08345 [Rhizoctonia solani AG-1 IA]